MASHAQAVGQLASCLTKLKIGRTQAIRCITTKSVIVKCLSVYWSYREHAV